MAHSKRTYGDTFGVCCSCDWMNIKQTVRFMRWQPLIEIKFNWLLSQCQHYPIDHLSIIDAAVSLRKIFYVYFIHEFRGCYYGDDKWTGAAFHYNHQKRWVRTLTITISKKYI